MSDRVILAVKFTPAGGSSAVRKAVGGFLRYVQHRDIHPPQTSQPPKPEVSRLLKYVAYRDRATTRADLFGPQGRLNNEDRKAFAGLVADSLEKSRPQLFRGHDGGLHDRRRAVYRLVISPERSTDLDLRRLTAAAVARLEKESGISGLHWIAAIHRNTAHHHVHLVMAGMHADAEGGFRRVDLTKQRLAAMKEDLAHEIQRQRAQHVPAPALLPPVAYAKAVPAHVAPLVVAASWRTPAPTHRTHRQSGNRAKTSYGSLTALRALARRYQRRMERELEETSRNSQWEHAA